MNRKAAYLYLDLLICRNQRQGVDLCRNDFAYARTREHASARAQQHPNNLRNQCPN